MFRKKNLHFVNLFGERLTLKLEKCAYEPKTGIKSQKVCCYIPVDFACAASQKGVFQVLQNGGFFNTCTMKQVLAQKGGFQNKCINSSSCFTTASVLSRIVTKRQYYYIIADQNKLIANDYTYKSQNNILGQVF